MLFTPVLGVFQLPHALPPAGHRLSFYIPPDYADRCIETTRKTRPVPEVDYRIQITTVASQQAFLSYTLSPLTSQITMFFQTANYNTVWFSPSKLTVPTVNKKEGFEKLLKTFYLRYAGVSKPKELTNTNYDLKEHYEEQEFSDQQSLSKIDTQLTQRWYETMIQNSMIWSPGGPEDLKTFVDRGMYHHFLWPRDGADLSTRLEISYQFQEDNHKLENNNDLRSYDERMELCVLEYTPGPYQVITQNGICIDTKTTEAYIAEIAEVAHGPMVGNRKRYRGDEPVGPG